MTTRGDLEGAGLLLPDYGGREIGAVLPAALAAVGAGGCVTGRDAMADAARLGLPAVRHAIVVVVDGLGAAQLAARSGHAPLLRALEGGELTAGFPTTTATSLALFGTGQAAGMTGMMGYTTHNPATGALANLVSWEGAPDPREWQPQPSLLELAAQAGLSVGAIAKHDFDGSGLTVAALRGGSFHGAATLAARVDLALARAKRPGLTYLYWGDVDAAGHRHGWQSDAWVAALEECDRELARLARSLPAGTLMAVTADHGMVDVPGAPRWDVATTPALAQGVELIAGEPRAVHVHTDAGAADDVASRWREVLGTAAVVMTRVEAIGLGLFGPVLPAHEARIGDVVVAPTGLATVVDSRTQSPQSLQLVGMHGSLTAEELMVPLRLAVA